MARVKWLGISEDGLTVTIKRYDGTFRPASHIDEKWLEANAGEIRKAVALDVETTGLNSAVDKVIEIAVRTFHFHRGTGDIISVREAYCELQDPQAPLSERVKFVTGLSDEQLVGKQIDWKRVENEIAQADVVVAHNASFDRPFLERYVPLAKDKIWACSLKQINWEKHGHLSHRLDVLSIYHGFFVEAHRALSDIDALIYLVSLKDPTTDAPYFLELVQNARRPVVKVLAKNSSFETKDALKERSYAWNPNDRCWQKQIYRETLDQEMEWLKTFVYGGFFEGEVLEVPLKGTFR